MSDPVAPLVFSVGMSVPARRFGPFPEAAILAYAEASGDDNPLHTDPAIAARAGLARPPVHGMLIMGCFEPYILAWRSDLTIVKIAGKFVRPVLVGDSVEISAKILKAPEGAPALMRLTVRGDNGRDLVCLAEAFLTL